MTDLGEEVGIISLFARSNYGNCLQRRAVHELIRRAGFTPVSLDTRSITRWVLQERGLTAASALPIKTTRVERARRFATFDAPSRSIRARRQELAHLSEQYFAVVVGSDQIWNPRIWDFDPYVSLLEFVEPRKRIAFAPSFGLSALNEAEALPFLRELPRYARLSTREYQGAEIVEALLGEPSEIIPDPTMVLGKSYWSAIADDSLAPDSPYVLVYELGTGGECLSEGRKFAVKRGLDVVELNNPENSFFRAGPADFIGLIFGADAVFTDSFHAAVFSLLGHSPFQVLPRRGASYSMSSRFTTLARLFQISMGHLDQAIDWRSTDHMLTLLEDKARQYLEEELARVAAQRPSQS